MFLMINIGCLCGIGKIKFFKIKCLIYVLYGIWIVVIFFYIKELLFCCKEVFSMIIFFYFKILCKVVFYRYFYNCIKINGIFFFISLVFFRVVFIDVVYLSFVFWYIWWGFEIKRFFFLLNKFVIIFFGCIYKNLFFIFVIVFGFCLMKGLFFFEFLCRKIYRIGIFLFWK